MSNDRRHVKRGPIHLPAREVCGDVTNLNGLSLMCLDGDRRVAGWLFRCVKGFLCHA